jgi:hypothetical protein
VIDEDIKANLNLADVDEDDEDPNDDNGTDIDNLPTGSTMGQLLDAIRARLLMEINQQRISPAINPWLVPYLKNHNFWIRAEAAQFICKKLKIESDKPGYYKGV